MTDEKRVKIAHRLKLARENAGLSQGQVARLLNMHRPTISEIEAGRRRVSAEELAGFANLYKADLNWLGNAEAMPEGESDRVFLAAREFAKLNKEDFDRLQKLLKALRPSDD